jgi:hypothetical protein
MLMVVPEDKTILLDRRVHSFSIDVNMDPAFVVRAGAVEFFHIWYITGIEVEEKVFICHGDRFVKTG